MIWIFFLIDSLYAKSSGIKPIGPPIDKTIVLMKNIIFYISFSKSFLYAITSILTICDRRKLMTEVKNSPLLGIDDTLTEEIYQNIIQQSKNPDNPELVEEYKRLVSSGKGTLTNSLVLNASLNAINSDGRILL